MPGPPISRMPSSGKIISTARVWVLPGKEPRMRELLADIKTHAVTNEVGGTLTYRVNEAIDEAGAFVIFEEYTGQEAVDAHYECKPFQVMFAALPTEGLLDTERGGVKVEYYEELL